VYKRRSFFYLNDLAVIVGNDMVDETIAATSIEIEDGHLFYEDVDAEPHLGKLRRK
jgi:hypothetical protein